jgi:hypothetical protein
VAQAKRYREFARKMGLFKTLAAKRHENPNVDRLIGAVDVWNWDMDNVAFCNQMKALGMDHVLWSRGGTPDELRAIDALGYLTSTYDIYQDTYPPDAPAFLMKEGWPADLVHGPDGDWIRGWEHREHHPGAPDTVYAGGVICSPRGLLRAKKVIPADLKTHPYTARFIDTTTASPWRECYDPAHPTSRADDRHYKMALLDFCSRGMKLVTGSETGLDAAVPFVHYFEGMLSLGPYRVPDAGRDLLDFKQPTPDFYKFQVGPMYRAPLWELVYHDCVVSHWYWGDATNKVPDAWDRRDLINILTGTPPMFVLDAKMWDSDKTHFARIARSVCPVARRLGYDEMVSHRFLTLDHAVQRTIWSSGVEVIVNFGDVLYRLKDGTEVAAMGSVVRMAARDDASPVVKKLRKAPAKAGGKRSGHGQ